MAHRQNVASLSLFYRYFFGRCSSELVQLFPYFYCRGRSTHYSDVNVNSLFPRTVRLWNSQPINCFPLINDPHGFDSRINKYLSTVASFLTDFLYALIFLCFFSCNSMPLGGCSALLGLNFNIKNVSTRNQSSDFSNVLFRPP